MSQTIRTAKITELTLVDIPPLSDEAPNRESIYTREDERNRDVDNEPLIDIIP